jgi:plasmid stability protein
MVDNQRVQADIRNLPLGVVPTLKLIALDAGVSFTDLVRTILVEYALKNERPVEKPRITKAAIKASGYEPVR